MSLGNTCAQSDWTQEVVLCSSLGWAESAAGLKANGSRSHHAEHFIGVGAIPLQNGHALAAARAPQANGVVLRGGGVRRAGRGGCGVSDTPHR